MQLYWINWLPSVGLKSYLYSDTVSVIINRSPVNDSPEGNENKYGLLKDQILTIDSLEGVLSNDIDVDGDTLTASLISDVEEGTLEFNSNGSFSYTPPEGFLGEATFTYSITDQTFETSAITATIVVTARPVAKDIEYSVFEDSILSVSSVDGYLSNDTDEDNVEDFFGQLISPPTNG